MSYCRFSSDNWKSDVYCYEHVDGYWAIHVAASKLVVPIPEVPDIFTTPAEEWTKAYKAQMEALKNGDRKALGLPYDGESFSEPTPEAAVARLLELRDLGYHVPQYAIEALQEEAKEEK